MLHLFKNRLTGIGTGLGLLALVGCGGGGSGSGGGGGNTGTTVPLTTSEIQLQPNDTWTYSFSGTFTPTGGSAVSASGTLTYTVASRSGSQVTENETFQFNAGGTQTTHTKTIVYNQGTDGSLQYVSVQTDGGTVLTVANTAFTSPGTLGVGVNASGTTNYTDKAVETDAVSVSGETQVTTPIATFNAWKTTDEVTFNGVTIFDYTEDRVPGVGHPVFTSGFSEYTEGKTQGTFTMTSTNVPLPS